MCIHSVLVLNNLQKLICHNNQPTNQPTILDNYHSKAENEVIKMESFPVLFKTIKSTREKRQCDMKFNNIDLSWID